MLDKPVVRLINNWAHDVGTGLWAACLLVLWFLERNMQGVPAEAADVLVETQWLVFWLMVAALVDITITGAIRLVYWRADTPPGQMASKRPALIGKHIAFLVVYGGGTWWAYTMLGV